MISTGQEDTPMRFVEAELDSFVGKMPTGWAAVKEPEKFWGDLSTHGRRLLKTLLDLDLRGRILNDLIRGQSPIYDLDLMRQ
jgi:hypothetical protein